MHTIFFRDLPVRTKTKYTGPLRLFTECSCEFSKYTIRLHKRWTKPEELFCAHAVAALELDQPYREKTHIAVKNAESNYKKREARLTYPTTEKQKEQILEELKSLEKFIRANSGSMPLLSDITYKPGRNLTHFLDVMRRKVTIKANGSERTLNEIEMEILLNTKMLLDVEHLGYTQTLNSSPGHYLVRFLEDPYNISIDNLKKLDNQSYQKAHDVLFE